VVVTRWRSMPSLELDRFARSELVPSRLVLEVTHAYPIPAPPRLTAPRIGTAGRMKWQRLQPVRTSFPKQGREESST